MKRIICLLLGVVILLSAVAPCVFATEVANEAAEGATEATGGTTNEVLATSDEAIRILKLEEGFSKTPYWDYSQWTVGYGTKCPDDKLEEYRANGISEEDAEALLRTYLARFESELHGFMIRTGVWLDQKQFDALLLFSYNCGTSWAYETTGILYNAIVSQATGSVLVNAFARWCNAGGQVQTFLLRRRLCEVNIYLNGEYSQTASEKYGYVLYDANGGTAKPNVQGYDTVQTAKIGVTPERAGATFLGWFTEKTGGKKVTVLDSSVRNARLYAHWDNVETPSQGTETKGVEVTVTANGVNIRSGAGLSYGVKGMANTGDRLVITATQNKDGYLWGQFQNGWICLKYTNYDLQTKPEPEKPAEPQARMGTVKVNDQLRVRKGPSTGYAVVAYLKNGARVKILEEKLVGTVVWGRIADGWISLDYVVMDAPAQEAPKPTDPVVPETTPPTTTPPVTTPPETTPPETTPPETTPPETTPPETTPPVTKPEPPSESEEQTSGKWTGRVKVSDQLRVRKGPSTNDPVVGYLRNGERVTVTEKTVSGSMTWGKIANGWISMDYVVLDTVSNTETKRESGTVKVNDLLRVRSGPGTSYSITAYLSNGTKVQVTERKTIAGTEWGKIDKGWISLSYVVFDKTASNQTQQQPSQPTQPSQPSQPQTQTKTVIADCLRIRKNPGISNTIVGYLYTGAKVEILETKTVDGMTWGRIAKGWISMDYVK